jgi:Holliday junction resolvasome RuvABC endonuclease subunit
MVSRVVLGIDPGYVNFGVAVAALPERRLLHAAGEYLTRDRWHWGQRIDEILTDLHARFGFDTMVMEEPQIIFEKNAQRGRGRRKTTASPDSTIGLWGSGLLAHQWCRSNGIATLHPISPMHLKHEAAALACSTRAWDKEPSKAEMMAFAQTLYGVEIDNDHAADAALAAIVGYHSAHARSRAS